MNVKRFLYIEYAIVDELTNEGYECCNNKFYFNGIELSVNRVQSQLPDIEIATIDAYYYIIDSMGLYQVRNITVEHLLVNEKYTEFINQLKTNNSNMNITDVVLYNNGNQIGYRLNCVLANPVTDIQSPNRLLLNGVDDFAMANKTIDISIKTHQGQFTALENVSELPSGGDNDLIVNTIDETKTQQKLKTTSLSFEIVNNIDKDGCLYNEVNGKYYINKEEITVNEVSTVPEPTSENNGTYYHLTGDPITSIYLNELIICVEQDYDVTTGELIYERDGHLPSIKQSIKHLQTLASDTSIEVMVLDTRNMSPKLIDNIIPYIVGYEERSTSGKLPSKTVNVPLYRCMKIILTSNSAYIEAVKRKRSGLKVDINGVYGDYITTESSDSIKYSSHGSINNLCREGFNGTYQFIPEINKSKTIEKQAEWINNKLYIAGNITIDSFKIEGVLV